MQTATPRLIFDNDGCDALYYPVDKPLTVDSFLEQRTTPLLDTQVDAISYCTISSGFSQFTHATKAGSVLTKNPLAAGKRNITKELAALGTDPLRLVADFCRQHKREVFWSMRMNDTHDGQTEAGMYLFPNFKREHPECLVGSKERRPRYGLWTAVDYTRPAVREMAFRVIAEVIQNYDIDGIELDFFRHLMFFKSAACGEPVSQAERDMMTELLQRVRRAAMAEGARRGRPIRLAVKAPDSVEYCREAGLDLERWMAERLIDMFIPSGYFQLNSWEYSVELGHRHGVLVYPSLDEARIPGETGTYRRMSVESYRARAMNVWRSGADGIYIFNEPNPRAPYLREIGDPKTLKGLDKVYFASVLGAGADTPERNLAGGNRFQRIPTLSPDNMMTVTADQPAVIEFPIGEDMRGVVVPRIMCHMHLQGLTMPAQVSVSMNGSRLQSAALTGEWLAFQVKPALVQSGANRFEIAIAPGTGTDKLALKDLCVSVQYCNYSGTLPLRDGT